MTIFEWFADPSHWTGPSGIPARLGEQLFLTAITIVIASLIALPIGILTGHWGKYSAGVTSIANLGRAIPTFALLLLLATIGGVGVGAALMALVIFAIPPILTNSNVAVASVDPQVRLAGRAMGLSGMQVLRSLELPLATPLIFAGLRTSTVQVTATATLAAFVGGGGLGRYIVDGFGLQDTTMVIAGVVLVAAMTMTVEAGLALAQAILSQRVVPTSSSLRAHFLTGLRQA